MPHNPNATDAEVFISYSSRDRERVLFIADQLAAAGVSVWVDRHKISGATRWAAEIVRGIKSCKVFLLMCSDGAMGSWAVNQELQVAGECQKTLLPLIIERTSFPDQMLYFLAGWQWIEVLDHPVGEWLQQLLQVLQRTGVECRAENSYPVTANQGMELPHLVWSWEGLCSLARFTNRIWPVPADSIERGLGASPDSAKYGYRLGSHVRLIIEAEQKGHLLLLDEGPDGKIYCLCPSQFAPDTYLPQGRVVLPQENSRFDSFLVTGVPGREQLLAIITDELLGLDWLPVGSKPARELQPTDINTLLARLRGLEGDRWTALCTYFDVIA